jgi:hypothetical protein
MYLSQQSTSNTIEYSSKLRANFACTGFPSLHNNAGSHPSSAIETKLRLSTVMVAAAAAATKTPPVVQRESKRKVSLLRDGSARGAPVDKLGLYLGRLPGQCFFVG